MTKSSIALAMAKQYLSHICVGEWRWDSGSLIAPDGTVIMWAVTDCFGRKCLGVMADYEDFLARSSLLVQALVDELERQDDAS